MGVIYLKARRERKLSIGVGYTQSRLGEVGRRERIRITTKERSKRRRTKKTLDRSCGTVARAKRGRDHPFVRPRLLRAFVVNSVVFVSSERLSIDHRDLAIRSRQTDQPPNPVAKYKTTTLKSRRVVCRTADDTTNGQTQTAALINETTIRATGAGCMAGSRRRWLDHHSATSKPQRVKFL